jgi:hypothetical protein
MLVQAVEESIEHHINHFHGLAFQLTFNASPTVGDDCIFYMQNTSDTDLIIEEIMMYVDAPCQISLRVGDKGTRNSATSIIPINANGGSGLSADGVFETGVDLDGGSATLTGGSEIVMYKFGAASGKTDSFNFAQDLILPKNETLTIWCNNASATLYASLPINFHDAG